MPFFAVSPSARALADLAADLAPAPSVALPPQHQKKGANTITLSVWHGGRKHLACLRTIRSLIENMIKGVTVVRPPFLPPSRRSRRLAPRHRRHAPTSLESCTVSDSADAASSFPPLLPACSSTTLSTMLPPSTTSSDTYHPPPSTIDNPRPGTSPPTGLPVQDARRLRALPDQLHHRRRRQLALDPQLPRREDRPRDPHARGRHRLRVQDAEGRDHPRGQRRPERLAVGRLDPRRLPRQEQGYPVGSFLFASPVRVWSNPG